MECIVQRGVKQRRWKEHDRLHSVFYGSSSDVEVKEPKNVSLSLSEAEYTAISELVKEALFVLQTLENVGIKVELQVKTFLIMWEQLMW